MTRLEALVGLNLVLDIGSIRLGRLLEFFGTPEDILKASRQSLTQVFGIGDVIAGKIASIKAEDIEREIILAKKLGLRIMTGDDADYPKNLKEITGPPIVLYIKGEVKEEDAFGIGIVGSRRASYYGLSCAEKFASELSRRGVTVISGMARGVDTSAHRGALKAGGRTIAVIGSGFNDIYPKENRKLADEIASSGAVVSEFPVNTAPLKQNFPRRNRLISGLSRGILVAEAARNSGALITADFALEQGREVFALPGKIDSTTSSGTNGLIKQGAKLVSCVDDVLEEFYPVSSTGRSETRASFVGGPELEGEEAAVYSQVCGDSVLLDDLAGKTNLDIPRISVILLGLQLKGLVKQLPGKQFIRVRSS